MSENRGFSDVLKGYKNLTLDFNGLNINQKGEELHKGFKKYH